ncbi:hypothetical protein [Kribbella sp. CA-293567]|uniref:hypothetical protein n=1 Tax=Kribbella sp. CA-293567 TaxID=3002436 RepID=UPI0022DE6265|nr:hypothetical protein [Kribbella sp. CA-293567]WBQ07607.1 hypothetical protein OX958_12570 [Kribbella sp. CA-293567]
MKSDPGGAAIPLDDGSGRILGYQWTGELAAALDAVDAELTAAMSGTHRPVVHTCTTLLPENVLEKAGYLARLPSLPVYAVPHAVDDRALGDSRWVLNPSVCFQTLGTVAARSAIGELSTFTARGICHRAEGGPIDDPLRLASFTMREVVFVGGAAQVRAESVASFGRLTDLVGRTVAGATVEDATDVFYGDDQQSMRRLQKALAVKREIIVPWGPGTFVSVASWNDHRQRLTDAFGVRRDDGDEDCRSACVAFGLERIAIVLLAGRSGRAPVEFLRELVSRSRVDPHPTNAPSR